MQSLFLRVWFMILQGKGLRIDEHNNGFVW